MQQISDNETYRVRGVRLGKYIREGKIGGAYTIVTYFRFATLRT